MANINDSNYVSAALLFNKQIREMRKHVEYEKFLCRMLIDNDTTRQFKENTDMHPDSVHRFIYNGSEMDAITERGKYEIQGTSNYKPTPSGEFNGS